jgi:hypothetical protein
MTILGNISKLGHHNDRNCYGYCKIYSYIIIVVPRASGNGMVKNGDITVFKGVFVGEREVEEDIHPPPP